MAEPSYEFLDRSALICEGREVAVFCLSCEYAKTRDVEESWRLELIS